MQQHICIVRFADGKQQVVDRSSVSKDNTIEESEWIEDWNYEDGGYHTSKHIPVEIVTEYVLVILADFIMTSGKDSRAFYSRTGLGMDDINRLTYSYSINIIEKVGDYMLWEDELVYTNSGIKTTKFDMYSYHHNGAPLTYSNTRLPYEVLETIDLDIILIKSRVKEIK